MENDRDCSYCLFTTTNNRSLQSRFFTILNGRTYYLMAANCFYRHDLDGAKLNANNAARNNFKVPESFLKELK